MFSEDTFHLQIERDADGPVVRLSGELDLMTSPDLDRCLRELTDPVVTIDFTGVKFIDSTAIEVLVGAQRRMRDEAGKLILFGLRPFQLYLLDILGLAGFFDSVVPN
jgi:anti-sigma B factor antagonist